MQRGRELNIFGPPPPAVAEVMQQATPAAAATSAAASSSQQQQLDELKATLTAMYGSNNTNASLLTALQEQSSNLSNAAPRPGIS
jgi:hypothetical protein